MSSKTVFFEDNIKNLLFQHKKSNGKSKTETLSYNSMYNLPLAIESVNFDTNKVIIVAFGWKVLWSYNRVLVCCANAASSDESL